MKRQRRAWLVSIWLSFLIFVFSGSLPAGQQSIRMGEWTITRRLWDPAPSRGPGRLKSDVKGFWCYAEFRFLSYNLWVLMVTTLVFGKTALVMMGKLYGHQEGPRRASKTIRSLWHLSRWETVRSWRRTVTVTVKTMGPEAAGREEVAAPLPSGPLLDDTHSLLFYHLP